MSRYLEKLTEPAWAAGLYDGEGCTSTFKGDRYMRMEIHQASPLVLRRFRRAMGGLGTIYGPYDPYKTSVQPQWKWSAHRKSDVEACLAILWPHLDVLKKRQARLAMRRTHGK